MKKVTYEEFYHEFPLERQRYECNDGTHDEKAAIIIREANKEGFPRGPILGIITFDRSSLRLEKQFYLPIEPGTEGSMDTKEALEKLKTSSLWESAVDEMSRVDPDDGHHEQDVAFVLMETLLMETLSTANPWPIMEWYDLCDSVIAALRAAAPRT